jgi:hypothetical protein
VGRRMIAHEVTACIPTLARPDLLRQTLTNLLAADVVPGTILVSEASADADDRATTQRVLDGIALTDRVALSLLPPPPNGQRCGNRNWLAHDAESRFVLFLDDDVDVPPPFLPDALDRLEDSRVGVVVAASEDVAASGWLTHRCHFRYAREGEPIAVGFQLVLWRAELFRSLWLDERIVYGSEESDISIRLYARNPREVCQQSAVTFRDRGRVAADSPVAIGRIDAGERSRCYVAVRRYHGSRPRLAGFLVHEVAANALKLRRPLPRALVPGQWRGVVAYMLGGRLPSWVTTPKVSIDTEVSEPQQPDPNGEDRARPRPPR